MKDFRLSENPYSSKIDIPVISLVKTVPFAEPDKPVREIKHMFSTAEPISAVVIKEDEKPVGLVMNLHLDKVLSQRYGNSLYYDKPISKVMDALPLVVAGDAPVAAVADMAMNREKSKLYDHIIVLSEAKVKGIVTVRSLMNKLIQIHEENTRRVIDMNAHLQKEISDKERLQEDLLQLNSELENRVMERTRMIEASNREMKKAVIAAQEANRAKSEFLANMSHELRTPLNHIIGFTDLVIGQHFGQINETQNEYLTDVLNSSKHLLSLINDILDLSKVEAGKLELSPAHIKLGVLLEKSITMIKEKALKNRIGLSTHIDDIPDTIEADEIKLKQIIYNLLSNAVKFTPEGGSIHLSARKADKDRCTGEVIREMKDQGEIHITITDSGIGIRQEDQERIFDPFVQVDSSSARRYQGTGLGLSLSRKLVELHNGRIWVESEGEGRGCTFHVVIPACREYHADDMPALDHFQNEPAFAAPRSNLSLS